MTKARLKPGPAGAAGDLAGAFRLDHAARRADDLHIAGAGRRHPGAADDRDGNGSGGVGIDLRVVGAERSGGEVAAALDGGLELLGAAGEADAAAAEEADDEIVGGDVGDREAAAAGDGEVDAQSLGMVDAEAAG